MILLKKLAPLISLLLLSTTAFSVTEKVESFDLNKDGIQDRFEYSVEGKLIRVEEDRDGDKHIDFKTILDDKTFYKIQWQYSDKTLKPERKVSYELLSGGKTKIITEVDKDSDGVFEVRYEQVSSTIQDQDHCGEVNATIKDLSGTVLEAVAKNQKGLLNTGLGYKVDVECYNKWGDDFNKVIKEVAVSGLQCLMKLDKEGKSGAKITGALRNAHGISKLYKKDSISLVCSENDYNWVGTLAHASVAPAEVLTSHKITHPFVSLNPKHPEGGDSQKSEQIAKLKDTLFHETLHNLGYSHNEDIEFSYTCGQCCFDKEAKPENKEMACKICTGNYKNVTDIKYVKDMVSFSQLNYMETRGAAAATKYLKENLKSTSGISILAYATSGIFNPIGSELSKLVNEKNKDLSVEDTIFLVNAEKHNTPEFKSVSASSKAISQSLYELYYNKSGVKAMAALENNRLTIIKELKALKNGKGNSPYIYEDMKKTLETLVYDMWLNDYPGDSISNIKTKDRAYTYQGYFKDI